ncbi:serine hydrolase domain-containing protein [Flavobacterium aquidurense]|uniref:Putative penicillin-binding protein n=1 Tax=Flavobacterium aquidurense TaxID=362413 RepID=A0A0Q0RW13_9FLAO|nr:serine hydrolase domain-containing protein [Flavobacterium aquidurense]KQB41344.1 putative penicillin-binding protein [Flavobacterium aquidurense]
MRKIIVILIVLFISVSNLTAQNIKTELDHYFSALAENKQFNGNVLIAENGKVLYQKSFGYADFSTKRKNASDSSFPIASITKTFTSTAILQLVEKGHLKLEDRAAEYLLDFPFKEVTIKQLLSHTAGLPIYDSLFFPIIAKHPDAVFTNKDLIPAMISQKSTLLFKSGDDFSYNNVNYNILALVIEKISGLSYGAYLEKNIFGPAGMKDTSLSKFFKRVDKNLSERYVVKYPYSEEMQSAETIEEFKVANHFDFQGHGDLISTCEDLLKYDTSLYNGKLLKISTLKQAYTPVLLSNGNDNIQRYGLGWITRENTLMGEIVKHDGGIPGGRTMLLRNLTKHQTIILFDNTANNVIPISDNALTILNGGKVDKPKKSGAKIYGIALAEKGIESGEKTLRKIQKDSLNYYISEGEINSLGYALMFNNKENEAENAFKQNTLLFPSSWNTYDSYGEILLRHGKKQNAIKMYQKSIELNSDNENGKKILEKIAD